MGLKEFVWGGTEVQKARDLIREHKNSRAVPKSDRERLKSAEKRLRGHFFRVGAAGAVLMGGTILGSWQLTDLLSESDDEVRESYEDAFRKLAAGDPDSEELVNFYDESAREGHFAGQTMVSDEDGMVGTNFWVAVIDPDRDSGVASQFPGHAAYNRNKDVLIVKRLKITDVWKGAIFGHEDSHAHDDIVGHEGWTMEDFYFGEVKAYEYEFHLLDRTTGGQLRDRVKKQAKMIPKGMVLEGLSVESLADLDALFPNPSSPEEIDLRTSTYTIGINFADIESRYNDSEEIKRQKMYYIREVFENRIKILPVR